MERKTLIPIDIARDNTALQQLVQHKFRNDSIALGDWTVGSDFSFLNENLPQGKSLRGVVVMARSNNGSVRVGGEVGSNTKAESVLTGSHVKDEYFLLVVDASNWCMTLGRPTYRLVLQNT